MDLNRSQNLEVHKDKILRFIEVNGPSLPIHVSNHLKIDSMLSSAFLSDLLSDKEIKMSTMRVGNSPLYYIRGQEFQLEKFANFLPGKEREAFHILKEHGVLRDNWLLPAIRVALRSIKDFAFPFEKNDVLYWRYIKTNEESAVEMIDSEKVNFNQVSRIQQISKIQNLVSKPHTQEFQPVQQTIIPQSQQVKSEQIIQPTIKVQPEKIELPKEMYNKNENVESKEVAENNKVVEKEEVFEEFVENGVERTNEIIEEISEPLVETSIEPEVFSVASSMSVSIPTIVDDQGVVIDLVENRFNLNDVNVNAENKTEELEVREQKKKRERLKPEFVLDVIGLLRDNNFEVVNELSAKKKDYSSIVKHQNKEYLCVAKEKKIITEVDIISLLKLGKKEKKPLIFVCKGQPNKKAEEWLDYLKEILVFKKFS